MGSYRPLLKIEVEHSYFSANICRELRFTLTDNSARLLERAGCLVRQINAGLLLLHDTAQTSTLRELTASVHEPFIVHWLVRASDALFSNYTARATHTPRALLMLDKTARVQDYQGNKPPHPSDSLVSADDSQRLGSPWLCPLLSRRERLLPPDFTMSVVVTAADVGTMAQGPRQLVCCLQARATVWKYCFVGDWGNIHEAEPLKVLDLAQAWQFDAAVDELLPNGQMALTVRSTECIPLQDRSDKRFQLRQQNGDTDKVLIKRLPLASPRYLSRETLGDVSTQVSEIYIYR